FPMGGSVGSWGTGGVLGALGASANSVSISSGRGESAKNLLHLAEEIIALKGLGHVVACACLDPLDCVQGAVAGGEEDDGDALQCGVRADPLSHREAIEPGHHDVEQHEVR